MKKTDTCIVLSVLFAIVMVAPGVGAQDAPPAEEPTTPQAQRSRDWVLRFGFLVADTVGDTSVATSPGGTSVSLSGGGGGFVSLERRISPLVGVEFNLIGMASDLNLSTGAGLKHHVYSESDFLTTGSIALGVNFHFVNEGPVDVYAGPMLAFNRYSNVSTRSGFHGDWHEKHDEWVTVQWQSDSEVTWGAKAGLDIFLGKKKTWSLGCSLTYMDATYNFKDDPDSRGTSISFDPLMFSFGAGFRF